MPVVLLDRLPLPSLEAYTVISVLLLSCSLYYGAQVTGDPGWRLNYTAAAEAAGVPGPGGLQHTGGSSGSAPGLGANLTGLDPADVGWGLHPGDVVVFMFQEPLCIWTLINMAYCCLILLGKFIQRLVFGELRVSEQQHIKDKFWNFVFYKFIFIFGVINVQFMDEVVLWCSWFSVLGFLHLLTQLCKDRFEYLSFSPTTPRWSHIRLLTLLAAILGVSGLLFLICATVGFYAGLNTFAFMAAECVLLKVRTLFVMVRYALHLYDLSHEGPWEQRGTYMYYTELVFELAALAIDLVHHLHMLLWSNIFLSMASLVICMQLRFLFYEIQRRLKKHKNYLRVVWHVERNYPMATAEELETYSDNCAICWDKLETARKLPCNHFFHNSCLRSWLEQDTSCPTCRQALSVERSQSSSESLLQEQQEDSLLAGFSFGTETDATTQQNNRRTTNHFFHFDGSRYVSWLPSFSVEVTHTQLLRADQTQPAQTSQLDTMARQVQQMFPHISLAAILDDLRATRSIEVTIENILEDRVVPSPPMFQQDEAPPLPPSPHHIHPHHHSSPLLPPSLLASIQPTGFSMSSSPPQHRTASAPPTPTGFLSREGDIVGVGEASSLCGRFSKSPAEREEMLKRRREALISQARRRYLARQESVTTTTEKKLLEGESSEEGNEEQQSSEAQLHRRLVRSRSTS